MVMNRIKINQTRSSPQWYYSQTQYLLNNYSTHVKKAEIHKHASCHKFPYSFATRLLQAKIPSQRLKKCPLN